ncbi:hypothetical protein TTHERM_000042742 (macronuclear) [Tetrahymena thermophila SB210]|uniref:Uncharacterized protein n=1 Tax=Tetrahymena thermophila (strain SB210) TaxID=312017 RepID=W7X6C2_TETTS|nr:hypothetical protein TTHERM_000042742 [Tetrahymena thermophila SB210]EWS74925.1 hypothetical protein TTHERM_000042742 [Tetrahymena thermophila SB210]|eukprot:XP_012652638.1 hypothetical protein TTHERM_000042742 [Tetrahymena thermophila SB210]
MNTKLIMLTKRNLMQIVNLKFNIALLKILISKKRNQPQSSTNVKFKIKNLLSTLCNKNFITYQQNQIIKNIKIFQITYYNKLDQKNYLQKFKILIIISSLAQYLVQAVSRQICKGLIVLQIILNSKKVYFSFTAAINKQSKLQRQKQENAQLTTFLAYQRVKFYQKNPLPYIKFLWIQFFLANIKMIQA